jgi:hypothetical protein
MEERLKPHTLMTKRRSLADSATEEHDMLSINPVRFNRVAGQKGGGGTDTQRGERVLHAADHPQPRSGQYPRGA